MKNKATRTGRGGGGGGGWIDRYFRYIRAVKNWIGSDVVEFVFQFSIKSGKARIRGRFVSKNTRASIFSTVTRYFSKTLRIHRAKRGKITMRTGRVSFPEFVNSALHGSCDGISSTGEKYFFRIYLSFDLLKLEKNSNLRNSVTFFKTFFPYLFRYDFCFSRY